MKPTMQFIGIDVGTLSTKGLLLDQTGEPVCQADISHDVMMSAPGFAEHDADAVWWSDTIKVIRQLLSHPRADPHAVAGLGVCGLFPALLLADGHGNPLRPALLYSDSRAGEELRQFNEHFGLRLNADVITPKLRWLRDHQPNLLRRARYVFSSHNYVVYRLTGAYVIDFKVADSLGGLLDRTTMTWDPAVCTWAGIATDHLPALSAATSLAGHLTHDSARLTGLPEGIPVIVGSGDSLLTLVGAGVCTRGDALLSFGTTGWLAVVPHDLKRYFDEPSLVHEGAPYILDAYLLTLGSALQWYRDQFAGAETSVAPRIGKSTYQLLDDEALHIPPGADGVIVLPYFLGERNGSDQEADTGVIYGLSLTHKASHIYRAMIESFGFVVRAALERLDGSDSPVLHIMAAGGGATSRLWRQIVSDIIGRPLHYSERADPCLGAAYLAGYALGVWGDLREVADWLSGGEVTRPSPDHSLAYDGPYETFKRLRLALADVEQSEPTTHP